MTEEVRITIIKVKTDVFYGYSVNSTSKIDIRFPRGEKKSSLLLRSLKTSPQLYVRICVRSSTPYSPINFPRLLKFNLLLTLRKTTGLNITQ